MPRKVKRRLTTAECNNATRGMHCDGNGLYLQVLPNKANDGYNKSWVYRYGRDMGLGSFPSIGLSAARTLAEEQRALRQRGLDPIAERDKAKAQSAEKVITFNQAATEYLRTHEAEWKSETHRQQWNATLRDYAFPIIGLLNVKAIETKHVMEVLTPIWSEKRETATRLRNRVELILDYARVAYGFTWAPLDGGNPARWKGHLDKLLPKRNGTYVQHHASMKYTQVGDFMQTLRQQDSVAARALEFIILTASRSGEVRGMLWDELDGDLWIIPKARMKAGKEHRVPLTPRCLEVLEEMAKIRQNDYVFPGFTSEKPLGKMAVLDLLHKITTVNCDVHGFRATFRNWCGDCTNFSRETAEMCIAHYAGGVEGAYFTSDVIEKRRKLLTAWAQFVATTKSAATVTPLRQKSG
jgi:integrase